MTELTYEQPLNEKTRSYLRLEYLADQLEFNFNHDHQHACFFPLFSLWELCERCDYRNDVIKEFDRQLCLLNKWKALPDSDHQQIQQLIDEIQSHRCQLIKTTRLGQELKSDRFLMAIRQRFSMPGASCSFDLPQLHFWLAKPWSERQHNYQMWCEHFRPLLDAVKLVLQLCRNTAEFQSQQAHSGFYQGDSNQALSLVRVRLNEDYGCYPTISGNRNRFAIHFVTFEHHKHTDKTIEFKLAACR